MGPARAHSGRGRAASPRAARPRAPRWFAGAAAAALLLARAREWSGRAFLACRRRPLAALPPRLLRRASAGAEDDLWREAYQLEVERNALLRDQLMDSDFAGGQGESDEDLEPEECIIDYEGGYGELKACNEALEAKLRGRPPPQPPSGALGGGGGATGSGAAGSAAAGVDDSSLPLRLQVQLAERMTSIRVFRRLGAGSAFYTLDAKLPLGLNISMREKGDLRGSFVVENVLPGGFAAETGSVLGGDVLHALTTQVTTMGVTTFDSGQVGKTQHLVDTSYLESVEALVEAIASNADGGPGAGLVLVFERGAGAAAPPAAGLRSEAALDA